MPKSCSDEPQGWEVLGHPSSPDRGRPFKGIWFSVEGSAAKEVRRGTLLPACVGLGLLQDGNQVLRAAKIPGQCKWGLWENGAYGRTGPLVLAAHFTGFHNKIGSLEGPGVMGSG